MPHKNPTCKECRHRPKMRHHRWIREYTECSKDRFHRGEYWLREVICPECGSIKTDVMMRTERQLKQARKSIASDKGGSG